MATGAVGYSDDGRICRFGIDRQRQDAIIATGGTWQDQAFRRRFRLTRVAVRRGRWGVEMKKAVCVSIVALMALLLVSPQPAGAHGPGRAYFGARVYIGPGYWGPRPWWGPGWWGPAYPYPYPYAYSPPVVVQPPPVYVQPSAPPEESQYWYYCQNPQGYYPYVRQCPNGWMKVVPPPAPPGQ